MAWVSLIPRPGNEARYGYEAGGRYGKGGVKSWHGYEGGVKASHGYEVGVNAWHWYGFGVKAWHGV